MLRAGTLHAHTDKFQGGSSLSFRSLMMCPTEDSHFSKPNIVQGPP